MAKYNLKFFDIDFDEKSIRVNVFEDSEIRIEIDTSSKIQSIYLDKSTAIKFAKTLRTEINKIQE